MSALTFKPATKRQAKLRMALIGPSGSGKTFSALSVAKGLGGRVALIDTERGSASKYADHFGFQVLELERFEPELFMQAIKAAEQGGFDVLVIDSLSHAWNGAGGMLEQVDKIAARSKAGNSFSAWREAGPMQNRLIDTILRCRMHVITTLRVTTEYVVEKNEQGKNAPRKVGLKPVQKEGLEYEFDVVAEMDDARLVVSKSRCFALAGAVISKPGPELGEQLRAWLTDGAPAVEQPALAVVPPPEAPQPETEPMSRSDAMAARLQAQSETLENGQRGGIPLSEFSRAEIEKMAIDAAAWLEKYPKNQKIGPSMQRDLARLQAELAARMAGNLAPAPSEEPPAQS